jgi:hypothetical protein
MMPESLGSPLLAAYERHFLLGDELMRNYADEGDEVALDEFLFDVHNSFLDGVHTAHLHAVIRALMEKFGNQQGVAEALGLKHRTSISQMLRSQTIDGVRLTAALDQFRDIKLPPRSLSALYGFARATSFVRALDLKDASLKGTLGPQEFSYLVGMLASDEWDEAVRHPDPAVGRRVAAVIARERAIVMPWPPPTSRRQPRRLRPEQFVLPLVQLHNEWGTYAVVTLTAIPECIPADEDGEATL